MLISKKSSIWPQPISCRISNQYYNKTRHEASLFTGFALHNEIWRSKKEFFRWFSSLFMMDPWVNSFSEEQVPFLLVRSGKFKLYFLHFPKLSMNSHLRGKAWYQSWNKGQWPPVESLGSSPIPQPQQIHQLKYSAFLFPPSPGPNLQIHHRRGRKQIALYSTIPLCYSSWCLLRFLSSVSPPCWRWDITNSSSCSTAILYSWTSDTLAVFKTPPPTTSPQRLTATPPFN